MSKFPLSYSRLSTFEQCPAKFEYLHIAKSVKDMGNEHTLYGDRVHKSLEMYGKTGDEAHLTLETQKYKNTVDTLRSAPGLTLYEKALTVNADRLPRDWFAKDAYIRAKADVLNVRQNKASLIDWKTGKVKPDQTQMHLFAAMVFWTYPEVEQVDTLFAWLAHDETTPGRFKRSSLPVIEEKLQERFDKVQEAVDLGVFEPKPSPLCRWCPAKEVCPYA